MIGRTDDAFRLHSLDYARRSVVADLELTLHETRRSFAFTANHSYSLRVKLIGGVVLLFAPQRIKRQILVLGDLVDIIRSSSRLQERDNALDLLVRDERAVDASNTTASRHVEHIAPTEQLLGAALAKDCAAVDLGRYLKADAGREIRFDRAGNDIDRRALRRHDQMDSCGPGHLREPLDRRLDLLAGDQHEIRHLVDHNNN